MLELTQSPPEGIKVFLNEDDVTDIQAIIEGPGGTPFEGGQFKMKLVLGKDFPTAPPQGFFITKIFHPNVASNGAICVNTLKKDWKADHGIRHILLTIKCLLIYPNPESALNEEAGKLLLEQYEDYCSRARLMTEIHAKPKSTGGDDADSSTDPSSGNKKRPSEATSLTSTSNPEKKKKDKEKKKTLKRL